MKTTFLRNTRRNAGALILLLAFSSTFQAISAQEKSNDKSLSPYFFVNSDDPETDRLPLKSTSAQVNIAGVIADVTIRQVYKNEGKNTLEAVYVFPASTRAAVHNMKMKIGEREIIAMVQERQKARQQYEQAKTEGKTVTLLEQQRPNVFQMNVANILPGDVIEVELSYTELLIPENGVYEFVYPTVVGPRYSNQTAENATDEGWVANPYLKEDEAPNYTFDMKASLSAGLPLHDVRSPSHQIDVKYSDAQMASITLKNKDKFEGNRDFILQYRLKGDRIESGILLFSGKDENFFLAMIQPPKAVSNNQIPPREYIFILDVSGSMYGFPLDITKKLMNELLLKLKPTDRFNLVLFAGASNVYKEHSVTATSENIKNAINYIGQQHGGGGTELLPALKKAMALQSNEDFSRSFVILTDGYVNVEKEAFDYIHKNLGQANFFAFGIGTSVNRYLIEGIAHAGKGESFVATSQKEAEKLAPRFIKYVSTPVLTHIQVNFDHFTTYDILPESCPDVFADRPVIIIGKYKTSPTGNIQITGTTGEKTFTKKLNLQDFNPSASNAALKYLWARQKIQYLDDYINADSYHEQKDLAGEVTKLGLKYNLLTKYTSFIAVDSEIRNKDGNITTVKQPLPLPNGVSNLAVGNAVNGMLTKQSPTPPATVKRTLAGAENETTVFKFAEEEKAATDEQVFYKVEKSPEFPGGTEALNNFIRKNLKYPEELKESGISGMVIVSFTIDTDGSIKDIKILRGLDPLLNQEAIRVIKLLPKWKPGMQNGKPVKSSYILPINFTTS
jgi:Ca-activated chloride channel homolog